MSGGHRSGEWLVLHSPGFRQWTADGNCWAWTEASIGDEDNGAKQTGRCCYDVIRKKEGQFGWTAEVGDWAVGGAVYSGGHRLRGSERLAEGDVLNRATEGCGPASSNFVGLRLSDWGRLVCGDVFARGVR